MVSHKEQASPADDQVIIELGFEPDIGSHLRIQITADDA
jgi:hypothetical protein